MLASCTATTPAVSPSPAPASSPTSAAQPFVAPSVAPAEAAPTPTPIPPSARPIPAAAQPFELISLRWANDARLWLVDPELRRAPELVAKWSLTLMPGGEFSASADRSRAVISAVTPSGVTAIYLIETRTGTVRRVLEDPAAHLVFPVIDPHGMTVAYTRQVLDRTGTRDDGIWVTTVDGAVPRRLADASAAFSRAWGWSADGAWLAYTPVGFAHIAFRSPLHVVSADGTRHIDTRLEGPIDWHPTSATLLVTTSALPSDGGASVVSSYDVPSGRAAAVYRPRAPGAWLANAHWHPDGTRFVVLEGHPGGAEAEVVVVRIAGGEERPAKAAFLIDVFWSSARLMALVGGDDSAVRILDIASGRSMQVCLRSDDPVRCV